LFSKLFFSFSDYLLQVQLVSASLSAFERKLSFLEQQAAQVICISLQEFGFLWHSRVFALLQVEVTLGISGHHQAQGRSVLDSINSRLGAVLDNDVVRHTVCVCVCPLCSGVSSFQLPYFSSLSRR
jgi:hypothetical protein